MLKIQSRIHATFSTVGPKKTHNFINTLHGFFSEPEGRSNSLTVKSDNNPIPISGGTIYNRLQSYITLAQSLYVSSPFSLLLLGNL